MKQFNIPITKHNQAVIKINHVCVLPFAFLK